MCFLKRTQEKEIVNQKGWLFVLQMNYLGNHFKYIQYIPTIFEVFILRLNLYIQLLGITTWK